MGNERGQRRQGQRLGFQSINVLYNDDSAYSMQRNSGRQL